MRYQLWRVSTTSECEIGEPYDNKGEALEAANERNSKPADGTLHVVKAVPPTADLQATAQRLIELLDDADATKGITEMPLSYMSSEALKSMHRLISRLECDRGFNSASWRELEVGEPCDKLPDYEADETERQAGLR